MLVESAGSPVSVKGRVTSTAGIRFDGCDVSDNAAQKCINEPRWMMDDGAEAASMTLNTFLQNIRRARAGLARCLERGGVSLLGLGAP